MLDDFFVINPVAHAYNMAPDNLQPNRWAKTLYDFLLALHVGWNPAGVQTLSAEEQAHDWPIEVLAKSLFLESDVDLAASHTLRLDSYFKDGQVRHGKTLEAVTKYPDRMLAYVGLDPTKGLKTCLRELDEQLADLPNAVGLKLYPAQIDPLRSWRMDDTSLAFPLFERAQEAGIKTIAVHKAVPLGAVPMNPFRIDDVTGAADAFPDLVFEIIHAGMAFTTETAWAIGCYSNIYANLEATTGLLNRAPRLFEQTLAELMMYGGAEKIIYSDGSLVLHSQPILERFRDLEFSDETIETFGVPLTKEDKAMILGGNYARIIGLDIEEAKSRIADDEFARTRAQTGRQEAYSNWRAYLANAESLQEASLA
ncbi:amidohydrolase family protein [Nocardia sp. SC052]|uniref:amidohydrolase family protein n=1 Tax=Nocardia sichangensis TaxID=3385975 RepID=UPI0039A1146A